MYRPFRRALESLRREFLEAGRRSPGLFYEGLSPPDTICEGFDATADEPAPDATADEPNSTDSEGSSSTEAITDEREPADFLADQPWKPIWNAFIEANKSSTDWEEWFVPSKINACGRFFGNGEGIALFKRLAGSLNLVLYEMGESPDDSDDFPQALELMVGVAGDFPTPLLRLKSRTWGLADDTSPDPEIVRALREEMVEASGSTPAYPAHPYCVRFVHDVFVSATAFIDTILDPDGALRVEGGYQDELPVTLEPVEKDEEQAEGKAIDQGQQSEQSDLSGEALNAEIDRLQKKEYVFKQVSDSWVFRFPGDPGGIFHDLLVYRCIARLLKNPRTPMGPLEIEGIHDDRFKVEFGTDAVMTQEAIKAIISRLDELNERIEYEETHGGVENKLRNYEDERDRLDELLDKASAQDKRIRPLGSPGDEEASRRRVSGYLNRDRNTHLNKKATANLFAYLKETIERVPLQGKWQYKPPEVLPWEF